MIREMTLKSLPEELNESERRDLESAKGYMSTRVDSILQRPGNEMYVASVDGSPEMAGYVWFGAGDRPFSTLRVGWIYDIQVMQAFRGKGIGEALMRHALEISKKRGFSQTGLMVKANNKVAYSLYEKLGFSPDHVMMTRDEPES